MKQAYLKAPWMVEIRDADVRTPADDEVILDVKACGICGSDVNQVQTAPEFVPFGHEFSGIVEAAGRNVRNVQPGDRVTVESSSFCGTCEMCRNGHPEKCSSRYIYAPAYCGFAEKVTAKAGALVRFDGLSFEEAAMAEPMGVAMDMVETADIRINDHVAVYGAGPIALLAVRLARLRGAGKISVLAHAHSRARIRLASFYGADRVICTDQEDVREAFREDRADRVLVTTPPATLKDAVDIAAFGGIICDIGFAKTKEESLCALDIDRMHFRRLQLRFSFAAPALFFPMCLDLMKNGLVDVKPMISHRFPLERMGEAMAACRDDRENAVKIMMVRGE